MNLSGLYTLGFSLPGLSWWGEETGSPEVVKFLQDHESVLVYQDWLGSFFASIKWAIIKWLYHLDHYVYNLIPKAFDVRKIFSDAGFTSLKADLLSGGLIGALLVITVTWFFIKKTIMPNDTVGLKNAFTHLIVAAALIVSTGTIVNKALDLTQGVFNNAVRTDEGSLPFKLIKDNTLDVFELAKNGWRTTNIVESSPDGDTKITHNENSLDEKTFDTTDMTNVINKDTIDNLSDKDEDSKRAKETMKKNLLFRLDHTADNEPVAAKIDNGNPVNDLYMPGYARFVAPAHIIIIGLISLGIALFFVLYTILKTILQLAIGSVLANLVYATDIESGQRTKAVVVDLMNSAAVIGFTGVEFYFYSIFLSFIPKNINNPILYIMALIAITMVLIFGSNAVLRYFNVDTALKNNGSGLFKAAVGTNMAAHAAKTGTSAAVDLGGKAGHLVRRGLNSLRSEVPSSEDTSSTSESPEAVEEPKTGGLGTRLAAAMGLGRLANMFHSSSQNDNTKDENTKSDSKTDSNSTNDSQLTQQNSQSEEQKTSYKDLNRSDSNTESDTNHDSSSQNNTDSQSQSKTDLNSTDKSNLQGNDVASSNSSNQTNNNPSDNSKNNVTDNGADVVKDERPSIKEQTEDIKKVDSDKNTVVNQNEANSKEPTKISDFNKPLSSTAKPSAGETGTTSNSDQKVPDMNNQDHNNSTTTTDTTERNTNLNENRNVGNNGQMDNSNNTHDDEHLSSERSINSEVD
ncbi:hypothetical protein EQ500_00765 [Lactobacillus sp. XV13L]|nr:hypothetical protein [Lactobacillus sp. XV13L]